MQNLNIQTQEFLEKLALAKGIVKEAPPKEAIQISKTASSLAIVYETARNAVEFRADHLVRQGAINRIFKRRLFLNQSSKKLSSLLIRELLWGRYLKEETIPIAKIDEVSAIIEKYRFALDKSPKSIIKNKKDNEFGEWLIGLAACEIEEHLFFDPFPQILINYCFESLSQRVDFEESDPKIKSVQLYIVTERCFAQNSEIFISYRLLKTFFPKWFSLESIQNQELYDELLFNYNFVSTQLSYPLKNQLRRTVQRLIPPFNLLREIIYEYPESFSEIVKDSEVLEEKSMEVLQERYDATRKKLNRASKRSIIYIFLTKMVIGLLLELPFDMLIGKPNFTALGINALFPPLLIFLLNADVKVPGEENSLKMIQRLKNYFYLNLQEDKIVVKEKKGRRKIEKIFNIFYLITYGLIFGGIVWGLRALHFNPVSVVIFLFFISVVSFFAFRVRNITKDYVVQEDEKESLVSSFMDLVFLPIIKVGQWLSIQISHFNILSFIFDFIIEAPLKAFLEVIEEWIHFMRVKKEEIIS